MTFIIAEVGSNWLSFQDCLDSIVAAKQAGADAVKLQLYTHKELYGYDGPKLAGEMPREWIPKLASACDEHKLEFMCTAFSPEGYRFIDPYVKRHKIASAENSDADILTTVKGLGKPVLMSTGGSRLDEIESYVSMLEPNEVTIMYCVSAYPAKNIDTEAIGEMRYLFKGHHVGGLKMGYSCHSNEWITPILFHRICALDVIEKHFKVRPMYTPDSDHSVLPDKFKKMVDGIRNGLRPKFPDPQEEDMVKYHKRRFIPELGGYFRSKKPE